MPTTPPRESHKLPVEMNLRLQQEISPSPTLLGSSSLHAMEKDHLPPQPICHKYNTSGSNKQHVTTKNTAKLDRETEELKHETIPLDVGKLIQQGRQAKGLRQKDLATKINEKPQVITDERIASKRVSVSRAPEGLHILSLIKIPYFQYVYIYRGSVNTVSRNLIVVLLSQPLPYP
ncbi:unnamed protein product [Acanthoscelides obtectus]|uniref:Multiprotein bridging factor 1 N-terminal domain-containing protein n=1 Tax=Acanthoscelides obtectus TaxID=200917 RepID=A0A9P0VSU6_ACAOB|nr:unnamed protein product [Acanthoscelides obtectus]CAK1683578.1 Endothelial differentiation-related factor 1 homolog [Acanthoscelides obtectus]